MPCESPKAEAHSSWLRRQAHSHDGGKTFHKGHTHWAEEMNPISKIYPHEGKEVTWIFGSGSP